MASRPPASAPISLTQAKSSPSTGHSRIRRLLFASFACYLDDGNGAAIATRAMMEAPRGAGSGRGSVRTPLAARPRNRPFRAPGCEGALHRTPRWRPVGCRAPRRRPHAPLHTRLELRGVPVTVLWGPTPPRAVTDDEQWGFFQLFEEACSRNRPDVVVSFGGGTLTQEILRRAKGFGASTVFPLHNLRYSNRATFADVDAIIVASRFAADHYRSTLGLDCIILPNVVDWERARAIGRQGKYVVFVNPTMEKGVAVFARIADLLGRHRPDIPFLVVEGAGTEADVAASGLDLREHGNVFFHEHTHDPRLLASRTDLPVAVAGRGEPASCRDRGDDQRSSSHRLESWWN